MCWKLRHLATIQRKLSNLSPSRFVTIHSHYRRQTIEDNIVTDSALADHCARLQIIFTYFIILLNKNNKSNKIRCVRTDGFGVWLVRWNLRLVTNIGPETWRKASSVCYKSILDNRADHHHVILTNAVAEHRGLSTGSALLSSDTQTSKPSTVLWRSVESAVFSWWSVEDRFTSKSDY